MLKPGSDFGPEKLTEFGAKYADSVKKLYDLPRTYQGQDGDTFPTVAEKVLKERSAVTGERVTPDNVAKETERLQKLNSGRHRFERCTNHDIQSARPGKNR